MMGTETVSEMLVSSDNPTQDFIESGHRESLKLYKVLHGHN